MIALLLLLLAPHDLAEVLEPIRARHDLPALAGAILQGDQLVGLGASGVRRRGGDAKVTPQDLFHLGSCTKAMTATLCALLVEGGKLRWTTTVGEVFPAAKAAPAWRGVTLEQLLTNRGGAPGDLDGGGLWGRLWRHPGTPPEMRLALVEGVVAEPPALPPGTKYLYSNAGFSIAGAMAERAVGRPYEELMCEMLFVPLGMASAGFGAPEGEAQPRGHTAEGRAVEPGPGADNPAAIAPAGRVRCTMADWAKFVALHLGHGTLLRPETLARLHEVPAGADVEYAMGWIVARRPWGGGTVLTHAGSNTMWYSVVWAAPRRDFAVLVACNQGGDRAPKACDEAAAALIGERDRLSR